MERKSTLSSPGSSLESVDYSQPQLLHRYLTRENVQHLHQLFDQRKQLLPDELRAELFVLTGVRFSDEEFETLFMKINTDRDNFCQWDELISYLILGFHNDDPLAVQESLDLPISLDMSVKLGRQTYPVIKIEYSPMVSYVRDCFEIWCDVLTLRLLRAFRMEQSTGHRDSGSPRRKKP